MSGYIFGSNPDALAQQRNVSDQMNIGLAENDQAQRQRAIEVSQQAQLQAQQEAQKRQDDAFRFSAQQQSQQQADAENNFRFNLQRQDQATATAEDTRRFNANLDFQKQQVQGATTQNDYTEAIKSIENGDIASLTDLKKGFPNLTPTQVTRAGMYIQAKTKRDAQNYNAVMTAANAATGIVADAAKPQPVVTSSGIWPFRSSTTNTPAATKLDEDKAMAAIISDKRGKALAKFIPALTWDEEQQRFMPAIPQPDGWQPLAQTIMPPPASGGPTTGLPPGVTKEANGAYGNLLPGTVYKGFKYVGGDPSQSNSWTPVNQ